MRKLLALLFFLGLVLCTVQAASAALPAPIRTIVMPVVATTTAPQLDGFVVTTTVPTVGDIAIISTPPMASVILDGRAVGTTSYFARAIPVGSHSITLKLTGYQDVTDTIVVSGGTLTKVYNMVPATAIAPVAAQGSLSITSTPPGVNILIDNNNYGVTPLNTLKLSPGSHEIELTKKGFSDLSDTVVISPNLETVKSLYPRRSPDNHGHAATPGYCATGN